MYFNNRVRRTLVLVATIVAGTLGAAGAALATPATETSSNRAQFAAVAVSVPTAPRAPTATAGHVSVKLAWLAPSSTGGAAIDKYLVQRAVAGGTWQNTAYPTTRSYTATGLTNGTRYYFRVRAHNAAGWSPFSTAVNAMPRTVPTAPRAPTATAGHVSVKLAWLAPSSTGGAAIDKYLVQRAVAGGTWQNIAYPTTRSYTATGLTNGTRYYFRVRAHNAAGWSPFSTAVNAMPRMYAGTMVTGEGAGGTPEVAVVDGSTGVRVSSFLAYQSTFGGGVRVAVGDVNGDGVDDVITGAGPGGAPQVKVFDGVTGAQIRSFLAFSPGFLGGVHVAAGDVGDNGTVDIVVGADAGGAPHVKVFDGLTLAEIRSFFAFAPGFGGGVRVAVGDVTGDGVDDVITGAGPGGAPQVKVFDGVTGAQIRSFLAFSPGFLGGVHVAAGDVGDNGTVDIVVGADAGGAPHVKVFDGLTLAEIRSFFAFAPGFGGGVRVAVGDVTGDGVDDVITGAGPGGAPQVKVFDGVTGAQIRSFLAGSAASTGGIYLTASQKP